MTTETAPVRDLQITRLPEKFVSDDKRVITRYLNFGDDARIRSILGRLLELTPPQVQALLDETARDFSTRHPHWAQALRRHFQMVRPFIENADSLSEAHQLLIGAFFTMEYSIESAALFNPSIVPHPDQGGVPEGSVRFLMSLRATGEGHISSIVFRRGVLTGGRNGEGCSINVDPASREARTARPNPDALYEKGLFLRKLLELGDWDDLAQAVMAPLPGWFSRDQLEQRIAGFSPDQGNVKAFADTVEDMRWLTEANYVLEFPADARPADAVIFPATQVESLGMEDVRLVAMIEDDGGCTYYGTYTAYDGKRVLPMILETQDFKTFHISTLNGEFAANKGMALFPRRIGGVYMAIGRHDGEKLYLLRTHDVHFWEESQLLQEPTELWELTQIGNCGSPLETPAGWVLLTHGVGPVRRYCMGAMLLDLDDPSRVLGRLRKPLIVPDEQEREGYVPNVVYSCGAMIHRETLVIPYAMSDIATTFATVPVQALIDQLLEDGP